MDAKKLGLILKEIRQSCNLSQESLCLDICSRKQYIRIEKGQFFPSLYTIELLSDRLGVRLSSYFEFLQYENPLEVHSIFQQLAFFHRSRNYEKISVLLNDLESKFPIQPSHRNIVIWYKSLVIAYVECDMSSAEKIIIDTLCEKYGVTEIDSILTYFLHPVEYKMINSLAVYHFLKNDTQTGFDILEKASTSLKSFSCENADILMPILFNISKFLYISGRYEHCLNQCNKAISILNKQLITQFLGDFFFLKGNALYALGQKSNAKKAYMLFISYYELIGQSSQIDAQIREIKKLFNLEEI